MENVRADLSAGQAGFMPADRLPTPRIVVPTPVDPAGVIGPRAGAARGGRWRRTSPGLYVPADAEFDQPAQRIVEAGGHLGRYGGVTGWASLHLAGADWFGGTDQDGQDRPVLIAVGPGRQCPDHPGAAFTRHRTAETEVVLRHGVRCLNVHRALLDEIFQLRSLTRAVAAIDMVLHAELTSRSRLRRWLRTVPRTYGLPLMRQALRLASDGVESPRETALRLIWTLHAELPPPLCNVELVDANGRFLARPDLFSPELGLAGEYDGAHHLTVEQRRHDLAREDRLRDHGIEVVTVVAGEMSERRDVVERLRAAAVRAERNQRRGLWQIRPRPDPDVIFRGAALDAPLQCDLSADSGREQPR
ncbi:hypothetical protein ACLM5J_08075 [Nocardioides sp. Bht2]|uniref:hypothetical protein n=1 Tax=Nocardioides sp. Bht2 TaxID=3392297 RepID=UPI0039B5159D